MRDEVRHASSATEAQAREIAHRIAAEGFTVWIFLVEPSSGVAPRYRGIATVEPDQALHQTQPHDSIARCAA